MVTRLRSEFEVGNCSLGGNTVHSVITRKAFHKYSFACIVVPSSYAFVMVCHGVSHLRPGTCILHQVCAMANPFPNIPNIISHQTFSLSKLATTPCSLSNSLVAARLVVTATEKRKWARALSSFWHIFRAIEAALDKHSQAPGDSKSMP